MSLATYIILSGSSEKIPVDCQPLGPVPQNELDAVVATLTSHKHLFAANIPQDGRLSCIVCPGYNDFCCLF
jgi:hypothetical protein